MGGGGNQHPLALPVSSFPAGRRGRCRRRRRRRSESSTERSHQNRFQGRTTPRSFAELGRALLERPSHSHRLLESEGKGMESYTHLTPAYPHLICFSLT